MLDKPTRIADWLIANPSNAWLLILLILVGAAFYHLPKIAEIVSKKGTSKLNRFDGLVKDPNGLDQSTLDAITEYRNAYYFKQATNITSDAPLRKTLTRIQKAYPSEFTWIQLKRVVPFIKCAQSGEYYLQSLGKFELFDRVYNFISAMLMALMTLMLLLIVVAKHRDFNLIEYVQVFGLISVGLISVVLFLYQNLRYRDYYKLKALAHQPVEVEKSK